MESIALLILPNTKFIPKGDFDYIGVDKGSFIALEKNITCAFCIGDFDSCSEEELNLIRNKCEDVITLNKVKDDTDSEAAIKECLKRGYESIWILDNGGNRLDHNIINLRLVYKYPLKVFMINEHNRIFSLDEGDYTIAKSNYQYLSLFSKEETIISLIGVLYPLDNCVFDKDDLYTISNEIKEEFADISIKKGRILIIQSKD